MARKTPAEQLAAISERKNAMHQKLRELNQREKLIKMQSDLANYKELAQIALGAIDVFGEGFASNRTQAREVFQRLVDESKQYESEHNINNRDQSSNHKQQNDNNQNNSNFNRR